jgi:two-component system response regulator FixJ
MANQGTQNVVCLVDDDTSVLKATARLIESAGLEAAPFTSPHEFLRYAKTAQPRLAVLDVRMPLMSGLELQACLRDVSETTQVIILSSWDDPAVRAQAMSAGALAFFLKPVSPGEFLSVIESALAIKQA